MTTQTAPLLGRATEEGERLSLEKRRTPELVFGFVGPVGSGVTFTARIVAEILTEHFD
jgi:ATP-dependent Clp protease ATP-binding subunit ClpA